MKAEGARESTKLAFKLVRRWIGPYPLGALLASAPIQEYTLMKNLTCFTAAAGALMLFSVNPAQAHEYQDGNLTIGHPWARPTARDRTPRNCRTRGRRENDPGEGNRG